MIAATGVDESSLSYRGWRVVLACFLMAFFMFGFGLYGQGVYLAELQRAHGWPGTLVSAASTFSFLLTSVLVIFTDDLLARIGLRALILCGLSALGASTVLLALMQTPWQLYLAYALMSVGWTGMGTVVIATVLNAWFERRRGLALSLAFNGATCGGIVLVPLLLSLTGSIGFQSAMLAATMAMVVLVLPVVVIFIGWPTQMSPASGGRPSAGMAAPAHSRKTLLANAAFWTMVLPIAIALLAQMGFIIHQVTFLEPLIGRYAAGLAVTIMAAMAVVGRLSLGLFVDRLDPRLACAASMTSQAAALFVLIQSTNPTVLLVCCAVYGFSIGNMITFPPLIIQREIGAAAFAAAMGLGTSISGVVSAFGPGIIGLVRSFTGNYTSVFAICVMLDLVAAGIVLWRPGRRAKLAAS
ncbi:MFS transporter [Bradyrhizobium japonicum]|uniref:MFS transporter n=1 Tax=Bradyrhizobium japonicum TaxID=375 RepID=UPI0003FA8C0E|nr:MFS transporter [Bradyrhizobium japonicum]MCP1738195.1 MFS family permease [Bradyrhizobium japonicum]MCP1855979.1 MFS family permease [Bradyrhizobium japonicum]MCP1897206.1 MFS family permease [Bradyrhizobium japonicum]MCW2330746.1 MFS family permease [Bradyrhizobium japonicum]WLB96035.1 MFS transporter [Bradyrhizobium japonicum USDA 123]